VHEQDRCAGGLEVADQQAALDGRKPVDAVRMSGRRLLTQQAERIRGEVDCDPGGLDGGGPYGDRRVGTRLPQRIQHPTTRPFVVTDTYSLAP
jgi:hypothetical protein